MSNKLYTEEFKIEAVRQVVERGYSARHDHAQSVCLEDEVRVGLCRASGEGRNRD